MEAGRIADPLMLRRSVLELYVWLTGEAIIKLPMGMPFTLYHVPGLGVGVGVGSTVACGKGICVTAFPSSMGELMTIKQKSADTTTINKTFFLCNVIT